MIVTANISPLPEFENLVTTEKVSQTRERILEIAERAVLDKGFGATSVDELAAEVGISKSGFFYHFKDKNALALALLQRYIDEDTKIQDQVMGRAFELTDDPLQACLVGLKMFSEYLADLPNGHPGCLVASICYQERLFNKDVHELNRAAVLGWRARYLDLFQRIAKKYPPHEEVDLEQLADTFSAIADGGLILSRVLGDPQILPQQVLVFRSYIKMLFLPRPA